MSLAGMNPAGKLRYLSLELCDMSPEFMRRFDYEAGALAVSIHDNGQIQPGVAIAKPDGRFQVIVGFRRLLACRKSFELNGTPTCFLATVPDEAPSEKEQHILALAENEHEKGQRQDFTLEEEVAYFGSLAKKFSEAEVLEMGTRAGKSRDTVRRLLKLSEALDEGKIHDAYKIEKLASFRFGLDHLEELSKIEEPKLFVEAAAVTASTRSDPAEIGNDVIPTAGEASMGIPWFPAQFPEYAGEAKKGGGNDSEAEGGETAEEVVSPSIIPTCYFVVCPHQKCRAGAPIEFRVKGQITYDFLWGERGPEKTMISPDTEQSGWLDCRWCGERFFASVWREGKDGKVHLQVSVKETSQRTATSATVAEACTVKRGTGEEWVLVVGGKRYIYSRDGKLREMEEEEGRPDSGGNRGGAKKSNGRR